MQRGQRTARAHLNRAGSVKGGAATAAPATEKRAGNRAPAGAQGASARTRILAAPWRLPYHGNMQQIDWRGSLHLL